MVKARESASNIAVQDKLLAEYKKVGKITVRTSQHAYRFYEKNSFALKEIIEDYWAKGFIFYNMKHTLA